MQPTTSDGQRAPLTRSDLLRLLRPAWRRPTGWRFGVPLIMLAAGLLFATTATTAAGMPLREDQRPRLAQLIAGRQQSLAQAQDEAAELRTQVDKITEAQAGTSLPVAQERDRADGYRLGAGLTALHGPGLTVRLDDAPVPPDSVFADGFRLDNLLIHQQDIEVVVNALWAGGAEAITIMGIRVTNTTAVLCVGNTLLLDGRHYSPEYVIQAIGDPARLRAALDASPGVQEFRAAVVDFGLGYSVADEADVLAPAYDGPVELRYASVPSAK